jgi:hypothetical protein
MKGFIKGAVHRDTHRITAGAAITAKRFVDSDLQEAGVDDLAVIGMAKEGIANGNEGQIACHGIQVVVADAPLAAKEPVKVGSDGRATKHTTSQHVIQTTITGEASAITQPGAATALEILQAADVEADRGRGIVIEGSDGSGDAITETINLDESDTTTVVAGTTQFTKIAAVYTEDGDPITDEDVTIRETDNTGVATLAAAASELAADIPAQSQEAYCNEITVTGPNSDTTFVTIVGINSAGAVARERVQLDGSSPSVVTTSTVFRYINRLCLGEFTNGGSGAVKTNATTDTAAMKCGTVLVAAAARGDDAQVLVLPNA